MFALIGMAVVAQLYLPFAVLPAIAREYGIGAEAARSAVATFSFAYAVGFLVWGRLLRRVALETTLVAGLLGCSAAAWLASLWISPEGLAVTRALQGLVAASVPPALLALVARCAQGRYQRLSVVSCGFLCAAIVGQVCGMLVIPDYGYAAAMRASGLLHAGAAVLAWASVRSGAQPVPAAPTMASTAATTAATTAAPQWPLAVLAPAIAATSLLFSLIAFQLWLDTLAPLKLLGHTLTPFEHRVAVLPAILVPTLLAQLTRWNVLPSVWFAAITACLGLSQLLPAHAFTLLVLSACLTACIAFAVPAVIAFISELAGAATRSAAISLYSFFLFVGTGIAPAYNDLVGKHGSLLPAAGFACLSTVLLVISQRRIKTAGA